MSAIARRPARSFRDGIKTVRSHVKINARSHLLACALLLLAGCGADPGPEVWVIGLDGGDWDQLQPMIERGEMPHLATLQRGGASGVLRSEKPLISPVLWTTIATGKAPDQHGITWFMTDNPDGTKTAVSSTQRRVRSLWNIASEAGLSSGVVGWWATWPAEPVTGFVVSDYVGWHSFGVSGRDRQDAGKTWPADLMHTVRAVMPEPQAIAPSLLAGMVNLPESRLQGKSIGGPGTEALDHLRQAIATSRGYTDLVLERLDHERPDLLAVYYEGTDAITHLFGDYQPPRLPWVDAADYEAYQDVVNAYWQWQDRLLGELLARRGPRTTVVVVSDHGFRIGSERRKEDAFHVETADADHMFDGIVVLNGPDIAPGTRISDADLYDVAPTVLYTLGLAVAADMTGRVLTEAVVPGSLAARPVRSVATYETSPMLRGDHVAQPEGASEGLEKMLRSLGYIGGADSDAATNQTGAETRTAPEEVVNLATVLMHQGRFAEAIERLRPVAIAYPEIMEVRLNLAQALARSGQPEQVREGESIYRALLASHPERLEVHEDLGTLLLNAGRLPDALKVYEQGLQGNAAWVNGLAGKGRVLLGLRRGPEAMAALHQALELDPRHVPANLVLGLAVQQEAGPAKGLPYLTKAHHLDPAAPEAALALAAALNRTGQTEQVLPVLQRSLDSGGPHPDLLAEKGAVLMRTGDTVAAAAALEQALALAPGHIMALGNLGMAKAIGGDIAGAVVAFEQVVSLAPDLADGHAQLGALYAQVGRFEEAEAELILAVGQDPHNPALMVNLGQAHALNNHPEKARQVLRKALEVDPQYVPALSRLSQVENDLGNRQEAARLRQQAEYINRLGHSSP